jgi:nucleoside-diphosphate-sugar epimerase
LEKFPLERYDVSFKERSVMKVVLPGGAGLVGQNLIVKLKEDFKNIVVLDKHKANLKTLKRLHPEVVCIECDLAEPGEWEAYFAGADRVVILQAQIGSPDEEPFIRNNIEATKIILEVIRKYKVPYTVHISSSVVNSKAKDFYTETKRKQEELVVQSGVPVVILRPTLMFGWFDRKHLGWLSRFMAKVPVFPIPGDGRYMRQPLFAWDFSCIIASCLKGGSIFGSYNISGLEQVDYIDIIKQIKTTNQLSTIILSIPYNFFYILLKIWALFDSNPPFTGEQLKALVTKDEFEVINWPEIFNVKPTPFQAAIDQTFKHPEYSAVTLEF